MAFFQHAAGWREMNCSRSRVYKKHLLYGQILLWRKGREKQSEILDISLGALLLKSFMLRCNEASPPPRTGLGAVFFSLFLTICFPSYPSSGLQTGKMKLPHPEGCPSKVYKVMQRCWAPSPKDRPSFSEIANMLGESPSESKAWAGKGWLLLHKLGMAGDWFWRLTVTYRLFSGTQSPHPKGLWIFYTNEQNLWTLSLYQRLPIRPRSLPLTRLCSSRFYL